MGPDESGNSPSAEGILAALPWRDRLWIKAKALWWLLPDMGQSAAIWALASPLGAAILLALSSVEGDAGRQLSFATGWRSIMYWTMGIGLACLFLPACRGLRELTRGGGWPEYYAAIIGVGRDGSRRQASHAEWAIWGWCWFAAVGLSWLDERQMRLAGHTLGHSVAWHGFNSARLEGLFFLGATLALAWLSKAGVFGQPLAEGQDPAAPDWSKAKAEAQNLAGSAGSWIRGRIEAQKGVWVQSASGSKGFAWFSKGLLGSVANAPLLVKVLAGSSLSSLAWWSASAALGASDPEWVRAGAGFGVGFGWVDHALVCALLCVLCCRFDGVVKGLWFGEAGPGWRFWAAMSACSIVAERVESWRLSAGAGCEGSMLIGSTLSAAFGLYLLALFAVEALALAGAFFEAWGRVASQRDKYSVVSYFAAVFDAIRASAAAATAATAKLEAAVAKKAVENEKDLAESLRKELDATLREPEPARRPSSSRRL